jgi:hypothetical protein
LLLFLFSILAIRSEGQVFGPVSVNEPFPQQSSILSSTPEGLPVADVRALALLPDGKAIAATSAGISIYEDRGWKLWKSSPEFGVEFLESDGTDLWAAGGNHLAKFADGDWRNYDLAEGTRILELKIMGDRIGIGTNQGLCVLTKDSLEGVVIHDQPVLSFAEFGDRVYLGTAQGLLSATPKGGELRVLSPADRIYSWSPTEVTSLASDGNSLWFGSKQGVGRFDGQEWTLFTGAEGLPYDHFTCAEADDGKVWFGTERGVLFFDGERWAYRSNRRWLPNNSVNDLVIAPDGSAWVGTRGGVAQIRTERTTLADKAKAFEEIIDQRHRRMDFVVRCRFNEIGNLESAWINHTDNDGLYTAMYGASQAFRYGSTKEPEAKERAKRAFRAMQLLEAVTPISGFPARSVIPVDWEPNPNEKFTPELNRLQKEEDPLWKEIHPRWPTSEDGQYLWKCDTSSDEICGHYFFYGVYYDLVAETEEEKTEVRELVGKITNHIVDNNFRLVDYDGLPTRWANWSPEYVNGKDGWADRGLQSLEILSFLNVAHHITGASKYLEASKYLREGHDYHINAISGRAVFPPNMVVPWDNNLSFLSYWGLLKYEQDSELLDLWQRSLDRNWLFVSRQTDPFFNFMNFAVNEKLGSEMLQEISPDYEAAFASAVQTLKWTPQLLIGWDMTNSHRLDVAFDPTPGAEPTKGWSRLTGQALPIDERSHIRINSDHFDLDANRGGGSVEYEGTFYLLPYYMGLYHGFLKETQ